MKLLNTRNSSKNGDHDDVWELIPWFVNGSLPSDKKEKVRSHIMTCRECAAEVARQHKLAKHVSTTDPFDVPVSRSWEKLRGQIESDRPVAKPQFDFWEWLGKFKTGLLVGGAGAVACLLVIVAFVPTSDDYRTLTGSNPELQHTIKFQTIPGTEITEINSLLSQYGLELKDGPSETGVYTTKSKEDVDLAALSKELMNRPEIVFAAPEQ